MQSLFGLPINTLMIALAAVFIATLLVVLGMAIRNRVMLKMGLRPIPRRPGMTALIIIGVMLSTVIISAAFGTGDTLAFSIRNIAISDLKNIDELVIRTRAPAAEGDTFGQIFMDFQIYEDLYKDLMDDERIDGITPQLAQAFPAINPIQNLSAGDLNLVGLDPNLLAGFSEFILTSGGTTDLQSLAPTEVYINREAAEEMALRVEDDIQVFINNKPALFKIAGILENGGFAGRDPTLLLQLDRLQTLLARDGQINSILVSNAGDVLSGNKHSSSVTKDLRARFTNRSVASELQLVLNTPVFITELETRRDHPRITSEGKKDIESLIFELTNERVTDELVSMLGDDKIRELIFNILEQEEMRELQRDAETLFLDLSDYFVFDIKDSILKGADTAGSVFSAFFLNFSMFSIGSGVMLIFLIFVLLAGARRSEMGMVRAVGAKRRQLVQMFVFEGTAYALVSSAIGVVIGIAIAAVMVDILNSIFSSFADDFTLKRTITPQTVIISYCLGMVITFSTVAVSAYRVSNLNIISAVRDLPESIGAKTPPRLALRLLNLAQGIGRPLIFLYRALKSIIHLDFTAVLTYLVMTLVWLTIIVWIFDIMIQLFRLIWPYILQGWILLIAGGALVGIIVTTDLQQFERSSYFGGGATLTILGAGLLARSLFSGSGSNQRIIDRVVFTLVGILVFTLWALPSKFFEPLVGRLEGDFDVLFVSGISMVGAAVWTIMYNADVLLGSLSLITGRFKQLRPVMVTAVAYPLSSKFRTGITLAMFALVIFTLMVMSILTETFGTQFAPTRTVTGGWDIRAGVNITTPIEDIKTAIRDNNSLDLSEFEAIGGYTNLGVALREVKGTNQTWHNNKFTAADDDYLAGNMYILKVIADGYGASPKEVFAAIQRDPTLVVIGGSLLDDTEGQQGQPIDRVFNEINYNDPSMPPVDIEVREPQTGEIVKLTVIGVLDRVHDTGPDRIGLIGSKSTFDSIFPFELPKLSYEFRLNEPEKAQSIAQEIERSFLQNGVETDVLAIQIDDAFAASRGFLRLFTGFMALGLVVGIAALGVISTRAVVERRQQIGMLRAIGYRRGMIQLSFLFEASFVALLGTVIGTLGGLVLGYNAVQDIRAEEGVEALTFSIPWIQMSIILGLTFFFSLLATYLPARQASRIYPAEALRYE